MPRWLLCCGPPNAVRDETDQIGVPKAAETPVRPPSVHKSLEIQLPGNKPDRHVAFDAVSPGAGK